MPDDTKLVHISRTVGKDQVVDELILSFTHDREIDFILPGVPTTGRYVELPHVVIMNFRDGTSFVSSGIFPIK
jgi:carboxymethylenebutenolidase